MGNPRINHGHDHSPGEFETFPIGAIIMYDGVFTNNVTIPGWYVCDGNNGTPNLTDKFIRAETTSGNSGGSDSITLELSQVPAHVHDVSVNNKSTNLYKASSTSDHNIPGAGDATYGRGSYSHGHTVNETSKGGGGSHENRPAYYSLIFIQKRA